MKVENIKQVAVIGSGTMGAGFSVSFALAGIGTRLFDIASPQLEVARQRIENALGLMEQEGVIDAGQTAQALEAISFHQDRRQTLSGAQFVLEAVPENLELKQKVFAELEQEADPGAVLGSNTSALYITEIASKCSRPEMICGMHWWNPPEFTPLIEVIRGERTSDETADLVYDLCLKVGHQPIMVKKEIAGFVGNRLQVALFREAMHILEQGVADPEDIDRALRYGLGFRWAAIGLLEAADLGGLDVWRAVSGYLFPKLSAAVEAPELLSDLVDQGKLGGKTGAGFYEYDDGDVLEAVRKRDLHFIRQWVLEKELEDQPPK